MRNDSCEIEKAFQGAIRQCYSPYTSDPGKLEMGNFTPTFRKYTSEWA